MTEIDVTISQNVNAVVSLNGIVAITPPVTLIDSLDGGEPMDITYAPINAEGLTGISGGLP